MYVGKRNLVCCFTVLLLEYHHHHRRPVYYITVNIPIEHLCFVALTNSHEQRENVELFRFSKRCEKMRALHSAITIVRNKLENEYDHGQMI